MPHPFVLFGPDHLIALGMTAVMPLLLAAMTRRSMKAVRNTRHAFAAWLAGSWLLWLWMIFHFGWASLQTLLPMNLCDWATIAAISASLWPRQRSYELAYFWSLAGTLQAALTPDLAYGFPDLRFIVFFAFHGGVIATALYLTFAARLRPYPDSIPRVIIWSLAYVAAASITNGIFKTNFGFLSAKPVEPSLMDLLAPWPWYIGELALIGVVSIFVYYAPFFVLDKLKPAASPVEA